MREMIITWIIHTFHHVLFSSKFKRTISINDIFIPIVQANLYVFTDWLKRLIMSLKKKTQPSVRINRHASDLSTWISKPYFDSRTLSRPGYFGTADRSNFPHVCQQKIHKTKITNLSHSLINAVGDSVKIRFFAGSNFR